MHTVLKSGCFTCVVYVALVCASDKKPPILNAGAVKKLKTDADNLYFPLAMKMERLGPEKSRQFIREHKAAFNAANKADFEAEQHRQNLERKREGKAPLPWISFE